MLGFLASLLLVAAVTPSLAGAQGSAARFAFAPAENGVFRLDTETGDLSLCMERNGSLVCLRAPGVAPPDGGLGREETAVDALSERIAALEARAGSERAPARGETMGHLKTLAERMMNRLVALLQK
jgi:hypothetical protein